MANIEMEIDSIRVSLGNYQRVVILKEKTGERYLPIWVGTSEADAIAIKMQGVHVARPLTHDFVCSIVKSFGADVKEAIINKLQDDCFYAKVVISGNKENIDIDCRPSDALAVAVRLGVPIFADDKVLTKAGIILDPETGKPVGESGEATAIPSGGVRSEPSRFEIFSDSAQDILNRSESESRRLNQNAVSTGHLLLAILKEANIATEVIKSMGVDLVKFQSDVESTLDAQPHIEGNEPGLTPPVKKTVQLSVEEAKRLSSAQVKPEHILIGLIRENDGIAAKMLKNQMINLEKIYIGLIRYYSERRANT